MADSSSISPSWLPAGAPEAVAFPPSSAEHDLEELKDRDREQQISSSLWKQRVIDLWGAEPLYEEQPEDRSGWITGTLLYQWIGHYIREAAREQLTESDLPKPTRKYRAYNAGVVLSAELQRQRARRHAWDGYVGARVGVRWDDASDGVLRWVGAVQQYGTPGQLYAGVEWSVAPSRRRGGCVRRCIGWLLCRGGSASVPDQGPGAYHRGEVDGEHLFDAVEDDTVLTCERVEDVVFRLGCQGDASEVTSTRVLLKEMPASAQQCPRTIQVWWAVWTLFRQSIHHIVLLGIIRNACQLMTPLLLKFFVMYLGSVNEHKDGGEGGLTVATASPASAVELSCGVVRCASNASAPDISWQRGVGLAALMFVTMVVETLAGNKQYHLRRRSSLQVRNALSAALFEKVFTMSSKALHHPAFNVGRLTNLMSTDVDVMGRFIMMFWSMVSTPFMLVLVFYQLYVLLGGSAFVGVAVALVLMPLQTYIVRNMSTSYRNKAQATDHRVKATTEFFSGIRVAKFMSWEPFFISRIEKLRSVELSHLKKLQQAIMMVFFQFNATPGFVIASGFFTFSVTGHTLTPTVVFPAIALFNLLMGLVSMLPFTLQLMTKLFVSLRRLNMFFDAEDELVSVVQDIATAETHKMLKAISPVGCTDGAQHQSLSSAPMDEVAAEFVHADISTYVPQELQKAEGAPEPNGTVCVAADRSPLPNADASLSAHPPSPSTAPSASADPAMEPLTTERNTESHGDAAASPEPLSSPAHTLNSEVVFNEDSTYILNTKTLLADVNLRVPRGRLTVVLGPTGSGKSTLLDALIGALAVTRGRVACSRSVAYVPQQPWLMNATLRENVVFFGAPDAAAFERALRSSQLASDLELLANGADTEIGENGVNLSGGQKARVSLARAVYADRDVYVLDDPLSALDAHVGERVMRECVCGALAGKTRVLATHQVSAAAYADLVVLLEEGRVVFQGTYAAFRKYARVHYERSVSGMGNASAYAAHTISELASAVDLTKLEDILDEKVDVQRPLTRPTPESNVRVPLAAEPLECSVLGDTVTEKVPDVTVMESGEEKAVGAVSWKVYRRYMEACGGWLTLCSILIFFLLTEGVSHSSDVWLSLWTGGRLESLSTHLRLTIYVTAVLLAISVSPSRDLWCFTITRRASYRIHAGLLRSLARARLSFFDATPRGRLINRMSRDMSIIDWDLSVSVDILLFFLFYLMAYVAIMTTAQPFILVVLVPMVVLYGHIFRFFCAANREMQRLLNISNSPVFSILNEVLTGRWTICTYGREQSMMREVLRRLDSVYACSYMQCMGTRWLSVRVELLGNVAVSGLALLGVLSTKLPWMQMNPGLLALSITKASSITMVLSRFILIGASVEASMNCVERVLYYTDNAPPEDLWGGQNDEEGCSSTALSVVVSDEDPVAAVPAGSLVLEHVDMRYRPGLPLVLRDVCFAVAPGQKVGVVGRTGSGKSTLLLAFLRLVEVCGGRMLVCGRDARDYGVRQLRQLFSMIPQDPLLFDGTVRSNVDPFGSCGDAAVWRALRQVGMEERVRGEAGGLDGRVQEGGANYSVGQRQLLCLARALLRRGSAFLLMDEATANVDPALDRQIQRTVQHTFRDYTVITIAHRLHTVAACDAIVVMDQGRVLEFGSPRELVERQGSAFGALVQSLSRGAQQAFRVALDDAWEKSSV